MLQKKRLVNLKTKQWKLCKKKYQKKKQPKKSLLKKKRKKRAIVGYETSSGLIYI